MTARPVLFMSNGYGEDAIAGGIVDRVQGLAAAPRLLAMPLVGEGREYRRRGVEIVGPQELMPSGGLILQDWSNLFGDFRAGLWRVTSAQIAVLRSRGASLGAVVAVGDSYPALLGGLFARRRVIMVGTAKSNWFCPYSALERALFRRFCSIVFARDEPTAATLRRQGVNAEWVGNGMMDLLAPSGEPLDVPSPCVALLPGSRKVAYLDLPVILDAVRLLGAAGRFGWAMALADSIDVGLLASSAAPHGWSLQSGTQYAIDFTSAGDVGRLVGHGQEILLVKGRFADVLHACTLVVGQAGTGNEQAVGLGKPVVSFDSDGRARPGWYRARQIGLLGDSMAVVERSGEAICRAVLAILGDAARYRRMQEIGYARMGPAGASAKIARCVVETAA